MHVWPGLDDGADGFVAEGYRLGQRIVAVVEMQVGSADAGGGHRDDHTVGTGQHRIGPGVDSDTAGTVDDYGSRVSFSAA